MKLRLKSRLKTIKCQKLVEDFTEYYIKVKDEPKDAFEEISGTENYIIVSYKCTEVKIILVRTSCVC